MTNILIVEDEAIIAADLKVILEKLGYSYQHTDNGTEALKLASKTSFDLFLLDISISGDMDGVDLATSLRKVSGSPLIFITSYFDKQTLDRVHEVKPEAYIVKPFEERNLATNIELALYHHRKPQTSVKSEKLFVKDQGELVALAADDIFYIEADDNYSRVYSKEKSYLLSHPIKRIEEKMETQPFIRVHKSYIVNIGKVTSIQEGYVFLDEIQIPVGRTYRNDFMKALTIL